MSNRFWTALLSILMAAGFAYGQCEGGRLGQWGGLARSVTSIGDTVFAGIGADLVILDAFNPGQPFELSRYHLSSPSRHLGADPQRQRVFSLGSDGLTILDASDRSALQMLGHLPGVSGTSLAIDGDYAYISGSASTVRIVDCSTPSQPRLVGEFALSESTSDIAARSGIVYVSTASTILIVDAADPAAPTLIGEIASGFAGTDVLEERLAVISRGRFTLYDISEPAAPVLLGEAGVGTQSISADIALTEDTAYVMDGTQGFHAVDVFDPANPKYVYAVSHMGFSWAVARVNRFAALAAGGGGVQIFTPRRALAGRYGDATDGGNFVVRDQLVFLAGGAAALQIVDIADPGSPRSLSEAPAPSIVSWSRDVAVAGDRAFVAYGSAAIQIVDIADPARPMTVGQIETRANRLVAEGGRLYTTTRADGTSLTTAIDIFDQLDREPRHVGHIEFGTEHGPRDICVVDGRLAVGRWTGVTVFDVTDPAAPVVLFERASSSTVSGVALRGSQLFTISTGSGQVYDLEDPSFSRSFHASGQSRIAIHGDRLYASGSRPTVVLDISRLFPIEVIRAYPTLTGPAYATVAQQVGDLVITSGGWEGLVLFQPGGVGDIDRNGSTGLSDLAILLSNFGGPAPDGLGDGDLNCDGQVGIADLVILLGALES